MKSIYGWEQLANIFVWCNLILFSVEWTIIEKCTNRWRCRENMFQKHKTAWQWLRRRSSSTNSENNPLLWKITAPSIGIFWNYYFPPNKIPLLQGFSCKFSLNYDPDFFIWIRNFNYNHPLYLNLLFIFCVWLSLVCVKLEYFLEVWVLPH